MLPTTQGHLRTIKLLSQANAHFKTLILYMCKPFLKSNQHSHPTDKYKTKHAHIYTQTSNTQFWRVWPLSIVPVRKVYKIRDMLVYLTILWNVLYHITEKYLKKEWTETIKFKMLYKCIKANTETAEPYGSKQRIYTTYPHLPAAQQEPHKTTYLLFVFMKKQWRIFWKRVRKMDH